MAFIENLFGVDEINLTGAVGRDAENAPEDVLVAQAMLKYVCGGTRFFSKEPISNPSGFMDSATVLLIERFQKFMRYRARKSISIDGRIERATDPGMAPKSDVWTIRRLNHEAFIVWVNSKWKSENYIRDLCRVYPQINRCLDSLPPGAITNPFDVSLPSVSFSNFQLNHYSRNSTK